MYSIQLFLFALIAVKFTKSVVINRGGKQCTKLLPIIEHFGYGYDLTEFNLYACPNIGGKRAELMKIERCSNGNKIQLSDEKSDEIANGNGNGNEYQLPDGVSTFGHGQMELEDKVMINNFSEYYLHQIAPMVTFDEPTTVEISKGLFISTSIYADIAYFSFRLKMGINQWKSVKFGLKFPRVESRKYLTSEFKSDVDSLPQIFHGNEDQYLEFVKKYGTHFMTKGVFGGINLRSTLNFDNLTEEKFSSLFEINSGNFTEIPDFDRIACNISDGNRRLIKVTNFNRSLIQTIIGGDVTLPNKEWAASLRRLPALISAEMVPISDLIEDQKKSKNVWSAIRIHTINAYKNFHVYYLDAMLCKGYCGRNQTTALMKRVEKLTKEDKFNATFLELVGDELRDESEYVSLHGKPKKPIELCYFKPCH